MGILRFPLSMLPMMITSAVQASVSIKRINKFMRSEELDMEAVSRVENKENSNAISISKASFNWGEEDETEPDKKEEKGKKKEKKKENGVANGKPKTSEKENGHASGANGTNGHVVENKENSNAISI